MLNSRISNILGKKKTPKKYNRMVINIPNKQKQKIKRSENKRVKNNHKKRKKSPQKVKIQPKKREKKV